MRGQVGGAAVVLRPSTRTREAALARGSGPWVASASQRGQGSGEPTDAELVARAARSDAGAFRTLVDRHTGAALGLARRLLRDEAEAEDVVQEGLLRLWRTAGTLQIGEAGVRPWLRRVVSNLAIDRMRSGARVDVTDEPPEQQEPAGQLAAIAGQELSQRVDAALKGLPDRQRQALTLFHYEGLSQSEVGAMMGVSDEAVESLLSRARRALRTQLQHDWQELMTE
jgi:RNA polymerase sigma-70 factor (ECF subfamily)